MESRHEYPVGADTLDRRYAGVGWLYDDRAQQKPTEGQIRGDSARSTVGLSSSIRNNTRSGFMQPGDGIGLAGIAQGHAGDRFEDGDVEAIAKTRPTEFFAA